jgi:ubiquinone/menaquinone biosynthesis C-methylase UbiE
VTPPQVDFGPKAARYDDLRPIDDAWWESFAAIVRVGDLRGRRVIDVGCGTGQLAKGLEERELARVWAVDASAAMVAHAKALGVNARVAGGESLPFKQGWFDRAVMRMVSHLVDRPRVFAEVARVLSPDGRLLVATEDPDTFQHVWLTRFFPSALEIERARFPGEAQLRDELVAAGFGRVTFERLDVARLLTREHTLAMIREKAFSTFDLLPADEYEAGLARAEAELPDAYEHRFRWLLAVADRA